MDKRFSEDELRQLLAKIEPMSNRTHPLTKQEAVRLITQLLELEAKYGTAERARIYAQDKALQAVADSKIQYYNRGR